MKLKIHPASTDRRKAELGAVRPLTERQVHSLKTTIWLIPMASLFALVGCLSLREESLSHVFAILRSSPSASFAIEEQIRDKTIVFLSEGHAVVNPILFLKKNIRTFYDAGVRYLFLEGGLPTLPTSENYRFPTFFPWSLVGWKYENVELAEAIDELNSSLAENEKLQIILAEEGNTGPSTFDPNKAPFYINERDSYAYKRILSCMQKAKPKEKAIVFYGGAHGSKEISRNENRGGGVPLFDWKPLGAYLKEYYRDRYLAVDYRYVVQYWQGKTVFGDRFQIDESKYIQSDFLADHTNYGLSSQYDAVVLDQEPIYGLGYQYVPTDANLRYIFQSLKRIDGSFSEVVQKNQNMRFQALGSYLSGIYYLKLYFGDYFDYSLWNPKARLASALDKLEKYAFSPGQSPAKLMTSPPPDLATLYEYSKLMYISGIDRYINQENSRAALVGQIIESVEKATKLYPNDLWARYWLAFALTRNRDYEKALDQCELIIRSPMGSCLETFPKVYHMAAECAFELGLDEKEKVYKKAAIELVNERQIEVNNLLDMM